MFFLEVILGIAQLIVTLLRTIYLTSKHGIMKAMRILVQPERYETKEKSHDR